MNQQLPTHLSRMELQSASTVHLCQSQGAWGWTGYGHVGIHSQLHQKQVTSHSAKTPLSSSTSVSQTSLTCASLETEQLCTFPSNSDASWTQSAAQASSLCMRQTPKQSECCLTMAGSKSPEMSPVMRVSSTLRCLLRPLYTFTRKYAMHFCKCDVQ